MQIKISHLIITKNILKMSLNNRKKLSFIIHSFEFGGAEKNMIMLANLFFQKGHEVDILVVNSKGQLKPTLLNGIKIIEFNKSRTIFCFIDLIKYFKLNNPNFHFTSIAHLNILSLLCSLIIRTKPNIIVREANIFLYTFEIKNILKKIFFKFLSKHLYKKAYKIVAISDSVKNYLTSELKINKSKIVKINNPVDHINIKNKSKEIIEHKFFKKNEKVILSVASLTKQKNIQLLLKALSSVVKKINVNLLIIGSGKEYKNLKKLTQKLNLDDHVDFLGNLNNPYPYMKKCDLFILSSIYEGLPNVLIEALVCETHIIATDCPGGSSEIIRNYGKLVKSNDHNELTKEIISFFEKKIEKRNINKRYLDFSINNQFAKYENLII